MKTHFDARFMTVRRYSEFTMMFVGSRLLLLLAVFLCPLQARAPISGDRWLADAKYLASDELKGRGDGTPELEKAAEYIAGQFRQAGLQPLGGSFFQPFEAVVGADLGPNNSLASIGPGGRSYRFQNDFIPLSMSSSGELSGAVAFVGYGITAPEYHYDDYAGIDVKGKIAIVLRHEPQEEDEKSVFMGKRFTRHAALYSKAINARNHGASALLVINDPLHREDRLLRFGEGGTEGMGVLFFHIKRELAEQLIKQAGKSLEDLQSEIDRDLSNRSFLLPAAVQLKLQADVRIRRRTLKNVAGFLPGSDPKLRQEVIVIGAHYDHLGLGDQDSLAPDKVGQIHHGADDNASGSAGVMELARTLGGGDTKPRRSVVFLTFAGEEIGLFGSAYYVEHPLLPLDQTIAMMNLDMIGRIKQKKLFVGGVGTSPGFRRLLEEENKDAAFKMDFSDSGYDASDHMSFARKSVPVLFFFSGLHSDYHKPSDTWEKLQPADTATLLELVTRVVRRIDSADERPPFVRVREDKRYSQQDAGQGYGAYFGSIPDFGQSTTGVKFADVRDGSPAANAGLKGGDVLIEFDGKPVQNLYDFTDLLGGKTAGDEVAVVVLRGEEKVRAKVKLGRRE